VASSDFAGVSYTEAVKILEQNNDSRLQGLLGLAT
jgi:hypothetical protein